MSKVMLSSFALGLMLAASMTTGPALGAEDEKIVLRYRATIGPDGSVELTPLGLTGLHPAFRDLPGAAADIPTNERRLWLPGQSVGSGNYQPWRPNSPAPLGGYNPERDRTDPDDVVFWRGKSMQEMRVEIANQLRVAVEQFKVTACEQMRDWKELKFSVELSASAIVGGKIAAEGTMEPGVVCKGEG